MRRRPGTGVSYSGLCAPCTGSVAGGIRPWGCFLGGGTATRESHPNSASYAGHLGRYQLIRKRSGNQKI